jgi:hypothetical protein
VIVIAHEDDRCRNWLVASLKETPQLVETSSGELLELWVLGGGARLAIASATMPPPSGLHVLAASRASGIVIPFIVIADSSSTRVRVFVSSQRGTRSEARVVDAAALRILVETLLAAG